MPLKIDDSELKVQQLGRIPGSVLARIERRLAELQRDDILTLAAGRAADFADYKTRCARIKTRGEDLEVLRNAVAAYYNEDDDDG
jgi:inosine/xanthosine triphosphate pyrophosphatase family protein